MAQTHVNTQGGPAIEEFHDGDFINRDKIIINLVYPPAPFRLEQPNLADVSRRYLLYVRECLEHLDFKGLRVIEAVEKASGLKLEDIYVPLRARPELPAGETWQRIAGRVWQGEDALTQEESSRLEQRNEPVAVETMINQHLALVILGDPGAGKSTLLKMLAASLARLEDSPLPVLIPLSAYAEHLEEHGRISLREFLPLYFAARQGALRDLALLFEVAFAQGQAVVLLDGLDEVQAQREYLVGLVEDFVREVVPSPEQAKKSRAKAPNIQPGNRVIVTSRFVGYRLAPLTDPRWHSYALNDWEKSEIEQFVSRWSQAVEIAMAGGQATEVALQKAQREQRELLDAIFSNPGIERLSGNPLLLTLLALIKRQGVTLPHRRVELYELYLQTLLRDWRVARAQDKKPVGPEVEYLQAVQILAPLALWLRQNNPRAGLIPEVQLIEFLTSYYENEEGLHKAESRKAARAFLEAIHRYSNLLLEHARGQYGFIHLTFEEYLAGQGLALLEPTETLAYITEHLQDPAWHETILLAVGALGIVNRGYKQAGKLLEALLTQPMEADQLGANVLLAGEALRDVEQTGVGSQAARRITLALVETMQSAQVSGPRRRLAGRILGDMGWLPTDLDEFVEVPAGKFLYGDDQLPAEIPYHFWIAKYPVANHQFARFVEAGGYQQPEWWSKAGWQWKQEKKRLQPAFWNDSEENNPLFPVNGVSWYEAEAYCRWLNSQKLPIPLPTGYQARLPTEKEWERAARGADGRAYPWDNKFNQAYANTYEYEMGGTSAVCTFPQGISPTGAWDMAGNVWEWTNSLWEGSRVLRGGSWGDDSRSARCAYRSGSIPTSFLNSIGFRVILSLADPGS